MVCGFKEKVSSVHQVWGQHCQVPGIDCLYSPMNCPGQDLLEACVLIPKYVLVTLEHLNEIYYNFRKNSQGKGEQHASSWGWGLMQMVTTTCTTESLHPTCISDTLWSQPTCHHNPQPQPTCHPPAFITLSRLTAMSECVWCSRQLSPDSLALAGSLAIQLGLPGPAVLGYLVDISTCATAAWRCIIRTHNNAPNQLLIDQCIASGLPQ